MIRINLSKESVDAQTDSDLARLPKPLLINILLYLKSHTDFVNMQRSCKKFYLLSRDDRICYQHFYPFLFPAKVIHKKKVHGAYQKCKNELQFRKYIRQEPFTIIEKVLDGESLHPHLKWWKSTQSRKCILMKDQNKQIFFYHFDRNQLLSLPEGMQLLSVKDAVFKTKEYFEEKQWILLNEKETNLIYVWNIDTDQLQSLPAGNDLAIPNSNHLLQQPRKITRIHNIATKSICNGFFATLFWKPNEQLEIRIWNLKSTEFWNSQFHQYDYRLEHIDENQDLFTFDFQGDYLLAFYRFKSAIAWNVRTGSSYSLSWEIVSIHPEHPTYNNRYISDLTIYKNYIIRSTLEEKQVWNITNNQLLQTSEHSFTKMSASSGNYGPWLATVKEDETVTIWNQNDLKQFYYLNPSKEFNNFETLTRTFKAGYFIFIALNQRIKTYYQTQTIFLNLVTGKRCDFSHLTITRLGKYSIDIIHSIAMIELYQEYARSSTLCFIDLTKPKADIENALSNYSHDHSILFTEFCWFSQGVVCYNKQKKRIWLMKFLPKASDQK